MMSVLLAAGCGPAATGPTDGGPGASPDMVRDACPRTGVVLADLRDVERAGEGLVSTTFGEAPTRTAAWDRAGTVLGILKQVWGRTKTACPDLAVSVSGASKEVDDAIVVLDAAVAAKDQKKAVFAANRVGLACPDLFDYFHAVAPKEIVRMDAVFRQLGIDAHFGDLAAAKVDSDSLGTDWSRAQAAVGMRAPMCHRVGGTATVSGDIDTSLANVKTALGAMDGATVEKESDNGALEIDTLELLFDCPPDNVAPKNGVGAACNQNTPCDKSFICDTGWGSGGAGKCAPDPSNLIGTRCTTTTDCGTDSRATCLTEAGDAYPGGYCFMEPCNDVEVCPPGATCVAVGGESPGCYRTCKVDGDCRAVEGYVCQLFLTTQPMGFGPADHACAFACTRDADCQSPLKCPNPSNGTPRPNDATYGKCAP